MNNPLRILQTMDRHLAALAEITLFGRVGCLRGAAFANGLWSGYAAIFPAAKKVSLDAQDRAEHTRRSGLFDVEPRMRFGAV